MMFRIKRKIKSFLRNGMGLTDLIAYDEVDYSNNSDICYVIKRRDNIGIFLFLLQIWVLIDFYMRRGAMFIYLI